VSCCGGGMDSFWKHTIYAKHTCPMGRGVLTKATWRCDSSYNFIPLENKQTNKFTWEEMN